MTDQTFPCFKCNGKGRIRGFEHIAEGVCFQCSGSGRLSVLQNEKAQANRAALLAREQRRLDAHDAKVAALCGMTVEQFRAVAQGTRA